MGIGKRAMGNREKGRQVGVTILKTVKNYTFLTFKIRFLSLSPLWERFGEGFHIRSSFKPFAV
jgi:hypothetical protein